MWVKSPAPRRTTCWRFSSIVGAFRSALSRSCYMPTTHKVISVFIVYVCIVVCVYIVCTSFCVCLCCALYALVFLVNCWCFRSAYSLVLCQQHTRFVCMCECVCLYMYVYLVLCLCLFVCLAFRFSFRSCSMPITHPGVYSECICAVVCVCVCLCVFVCVCVCLCVFECTWVWWISRRQFTEH